MPITAAQPSTEPFGVHSEAGVLRHVVVHRPGIELSRLTPNNVESLLFDDVLWADRARDEHDLFVAALEQHGVVVEHFGDLLATTLEDPAGRAEILDQICRPEMVGPSLVGQIRALADDAESVTLADFLIGGITKADLHPTHVHSLTWSALRRDDFVLTPLPNHLFQRDNSSWVYGGVTINTMAMPARQRETIHSRAIYRHHPLFAGAEFDIWFGGDDREHRPASIEGGDVHVIGNGSVLIGMGERTTPMAVEMVAEALFAKGAAQRVLAVELPHSHAFMHLDTVMTMIDRDTFIAYPYLDDHIRSWTITPHAERPNGQTVTANGDLWAALAEALGIDKVRVISVDEDERAAQREQWDDGTNFLAIAPGVVLGWDRNVATNRTLADHGIEVVALSGSELGRGRGGPRCMTCPIRRDAL